MAVRTSLATPVSLKQNSKRRAPPPCRHFYVGVYGEPGRMRRTLVPTPINSDHFPALVLPYDSILDTFVQ